MVAGYLDPAVARQIFGNPDGVLAWGPSPGATAVVVQDGYILNYKASFASGSRHATSLGANCRVYEADGKPRVRADGHHELRTFMFPKSHVEISKDWNTVGLRGTGSDSYVAQDLFVPSSHSIIRDDEATRCDTSPHYRYSSTMIYSSGFGHVALGIARGFMEDFMELALHKTPREGRSSLRDSTTVQSEMAQCRAKWSAARLLPALVHRRGLEHSTDDRTPYVRAACRRSASGDLRHPCGQGSRRLVVRCRRLTLDPA